MRILYLTESTGWSGGAQQTLWMAGALLRKGHSLILGCQPGSEIGKRAQAQRIPTVPLRMRQDYDLPAAFRVSELIKRERLELLHAQHSTAHAIGLMAATFSKVPVFIVSRRVMFPIKKNFFSRLKYLSRRIDGYVAISEAVRSELVGAHVMPERIRVIPSVVHFTPAPASARTQIRQALRITNQPLIGCIGNYADFKGQDILAKAFPSVLQMHPSAQLLFAGRGVESMRILMEKLGIQKSVHLLGFRDDVPDLLAALDVFVMPSLQEAAGTALREAMYAGLPCIGTQVGGIPESINDGQNGLLVPPSDPAALANAIHRVLKDLPSAQTMAQRAREKVERLFTLGSASCAMERFYSELLAKNK